MWATLIVDGCGRAVVVLVVVMVVAVVFVVLVARWSCWWLCWLWVEMPLVVVMGLANPQACRTLSGFPRRAGLLGRTTLVPPRLLTTMTMTLGVSSVVSQAVLGVVCCRLWLLVVVVILQAMLAVVYCRRWLLVVVVTSSVMEMVVFHRRWSVLVFVSLVVALGAAMGIASDHVSDLLDSHPGLSCVKIVSGSLQVLVVSFSVSVLVFVPASVSMWQQVKVVGSVSVSVLVLVPASVSVRQQVVAALVRRQYETDGPKL